MKRKQPAQAHHRTEITIERETISVHYEAGSNYQGLCPQCGCEAPMVTAEAASASLGTSRRQMYRWLEENKFHFQESAAGDTFVCSVSLDAFRSTIRGHPASRAIPPGESP
jgi:hypothetical protein